MSLLQRNLTAAALSTALFSSAVGSALAEPKVVTSIKPVHSLAALVMEGVGSPDLIVGGAASPHAYALKPSQARALEDADLVFWIGPELETFLSKPIETIGAEARAVALSAADGLVKLPFREAGPFESHAHGDAHDDDAADGHSDHQDDGHENGHGHGKEDEHAHDMEHDGGHDGDHAHDGDKDYDHDKEHADGDGHAHDDAHEQDHAEAHNHAHGEFDAHIWLDPVNAKAMIKAISMELGRIDPENDAVYARNAAIASARLDSLIEEVGTLLAPAHDKGFIVFHDAYQYFEKRFDIQASGSITVNPDVKPSAERVAAIRDKVEDLEAVCAFSEPQFDPRLIAVVIEGTDARSATLDPLGAGIDDGPDLYFDLIRQMATSMHRCLTGEG